MTETTVLIPVRYPLTDPGVRTLSHALDLAASLENPTLYVLHVNLIHKGGDVTTDELRRAVEDEFGTIPEASYNTRKAFLLDEEILNEAGEVGADHVVIGASLRSRLRQIIERSLHLSVDLDSFLADHLDAELVVV